MHYDPQLHGPQPIFNAPAAVVGLVVGLIGIHVGISVLAALSVDAATNLVLSGAIVAARYGAVLGLADPPTIAEFPTDPASLAAPFVSHIFLHANLLHLTFNALWLLVFGTAVARRLGAVGILTGIDRFFRFGVFLTFFLTSGVVAGLTFVALNPTMEIPLVGASGAVSGLMGGAARFVFRRPLIGSVYDAPLAPTGERTVVSFTLAWLLINLVFAFSGPIFGGEGVAVAWEAHLGGYFFGLFAYPVFDRAARGAAASPARP
ncbi:MAG: rhomboid family intramembrane serine protease [Parvularculaceae bacterium]